jgi:hypothetical protein
MGGEVALQESLEADLFLGQAIATGYEAADPADHG